MKRRLCLKLDKATSSVMRYVEKIAVVVMFGQRVIAGRVRRGEVANKFAMHLVHHPVSEYVLVQLN